jgi:hypothetical protein
LNPNKHHANIFSCDVLDKSYVIANNTVYARDESGKECSITKSELDLLIDELTASDDENAEWCLDKVERFGNRML